MPGIKSTGFTQVRFKLAQLGLVGLALFISHPAVAEAPRSGIQSLEWNAAEAAPATSTAEIAHDDVWQRIRGGFRIDDAAAQNPLVAVHESWYAARPDYMQRMIDRSRRYLYHIVEEVDRRAMPMEIALLPMIESAFNPTALSPSDASGIWQFIPSTGRHYGLKQDNWYDGRRDFTAATRAALDYLDKLYLDFGDWQLALAAYNCGEGCVARAIQKNIQLGLPTDYASLSLPNETRHYVPKLLAIKHLVSNPAQYDFTIDTLPNQPYFSQVTVQGSMDLHSAARLAGMSKDEFIALNAAFPRNLIRSDTPVSLLLPVDKTVKFQRNLETGNWDSWQPYAAKKGERPEAIAKRFDVSVARLKEHNQFHLKRGKLARAQTILVPVKGRGVIAAKSAAPATQTVAPTQHEVQPGDTLYSLARRYGLSVDQITQANPDLNGSLRVGLSLRLPVSAQPAAVQPVRATGPIQLVAHAPRSIQPAKAERYTVKRGDTLGGIAQRFDISLADIKAWNPALRKSNTIRAGQSVVVEKP